MRVARVAEIVEDFSAARFDAIIAATPVIGQRFAKLNRNTVVVNNFPLPSEFPVVPAWGTRERAVCYVGGISRERGILELLRAMEQVDAELHLAGTVSPENLLKELERMPAWSKVHFHGFVRRAEVFDILRRCRAGLVCLQPEPNHIDSQPIKLYEYWSAGLPVIASDFPRWKEVILGRDAGICVNPADCNAIAAAIRLLLDDEPTAIRLGENGRELVCSTLNWANEETKLVALYRELTKAM
jgi:glycosyltransferase involved in cell wall biosynthesis